MYIGVPIAEFNYINTQHNTLKFINTIHEALRSTQIFLSFNLTAYVVGVFKNERFTIIVRPISCLCGIFNDNRLSLNLGVLIAVLVY